MIYSKQISFIFIDFSVLIFFFSPKALLLNLFTSFLELKNCLLNISLKIFIPFSRQFYLFSFPVNSNFLRQNVNFLIYMSLSY